MIDVKLHKSMNCEIQLFPIAGTMTLFYLFISSFTNPTDHCLFFFFSSQSPSPSTSQFLFSGGQASNEYQLNKAYQVEGCSRQSHMRIWVPKTEKGVRNNPCSTYWEFHNRTKLHSCNIFAEVLVHSSASFLVLSSISVSPYKFTLVDSVGYFFVVLWTSLALKSFSCPPLQDSLTWA